MNSYNVSSVSDGSFCCSNCFRPGSECPGIFGRREANGGADLRKFSGAIHCCVVD